MFWSVVGITIICFTVSWFIFSLIWGANQPSKYDEEL